MSLLPPGPAKGWALLEEDEDARVCRDIPEDACTQQPEAYRLQLAAQSLSKLADTLASSRVVLPWLFAAIAVPGAFIAWLVPLRESLSLLPQLVVAAQLRRHPRRRGFYVSGALAQGLCLLAMPLTLLLDSARGSGLLILLLLSLFSLARGVCSVAAKDVLGKTVSKSRRGRLTGLAGSVAGLFTVVLALALMLSGEGNGATGDLWLLVTMLLAAGLCWLAVARVYRRVPEVPGATEGGANALDKALESLGLLRSDAPFRHFVLTRMLLVSAAYAIPYLVVAAQRASGGTQTLGAILLAEGLAALSSSALWGLWSDRQAPRVMASAAALTAIILLVTLWLLTAAPTLMERFWVVGLLLYGAAVAHQGARVGRKTYLVDLATAETRASYVAVSNTVIGLFMLAGGALGVVDSLFGMSAVLVLLLGMAVVGATMALRLAPVH